jgi:hypothetical protein
MEDIFASYEFGQDERAQLDCAGQFLFPGLLTASARGHLTQALSAIQALMPGDEDYKPNHYAAEYNAYLASLIAHPQLVGLARTVLGEPLRFDHCVTLNRPGGDGGAHWHSHEYGEEDRNLGFLRIFFYVNGFRPDDGGLKVVPGSHLYRDATIRAVSDEELLSGWMAGKLHPQTGEALAIEELSAPEGTVALMWTHAAHGVNPRQDNSDTRWAVVYAYRNPGLPSRARWISEGFEKKGVEGAEGLMSLY